MKIAKLTPLAFVAAIIVGVVLSFAFAAVTSPHVVEQPVIVITPVPTPQPVYNIQPTVAPVQQDVVPDSDKNMAIVMTLFKFGIIVSVAAIIMVILMQAGLLPRPGD